MSKHVLITGGAGFIGSHLAHELLRQGQCFTPPSRGRRECYTSPPIDIGEFATFTREVVERYAPADATRAIPPATPATPATAS